MREFHPPYTRPFTAQVYYFIPRRWLADIDHPQESDARELLMYAHVPDTGELQFPDERPTTYWVRANDEGQPLLMSHVTFERFLSRVTVQPLARKAKDRRVNNADDAAPDPEPALPENPLVERQQGPVEWFFICDWPAVCLAGIIYKPRAYLEKRWPARLGAYNWAARAALLAFFDLATVATPPNAAEVVLRESTSHQIRLHIETLMPSFRDGHRIAESLRQLKSMGLLAENRVTNNNLHYRLALDGFHRVPVAEDREIGAMCGLHTQHDAHWIDLIQEFLLAQGRPPADAPAIWEQLRAYQKELAGVEEVDALAGMVRARAGRRSTGVIRVMRDFLSQRREFRHWSHSHPFTVRAPGYDIQYASGILMPALYGAHVHLRATQLVLRVERSGRLSREDAARLLSGVDITIMQGPTPHPVIDGLRVTKKDVELEKVIDCSGLHGQLDYSRPFDLQVRRRPPKNGEPEMDLRGIDNLKLVGYFRVDVTGK